MAKKIQVYKVHTQTDFNQLDENGQVVFIDLLQSFAAASNVDFRLLSFVSPWKSDKWRETRGKLAQRAPHTWQKRGLQQEIRLGTVITDQIELKSISHYLITYDFLAGPGDLRGWGITAQKAFPPIPLSGTYAAHIDHLWPTTMEDGLPVVDKGRPYAMLIAAYELKDKWDWMNPLTSLLTNATGPTVLCIDTQRISQRAIEFAVNNWQSAIGDATRISDKETVLNLQDADHIVTSTTRGIGLHNTRIVLMLLDTDLKRLRKRVQEAKTKLSPFMNITDLSGAQDSAAMLFSPVHNPPLPDIQHNVLSPGIGRMFGVLGFSSDDKYDGIYMGVGRGIYGNVTGLTYVNPWVGQEAAHMLCLGKTGFGKTVGMQAFSVRQAELGAQVIFIEPQGHSVRMFNYLGPENAVYNKVSYDDLSYNPLDVTTPSFADQFDYFIVLLEFLLNPRGDDPKRPMRYLSNREMAAVNEALQNTYRGFDWEDLLNDQSKTPLLEIFVSWLKKSLGGEDLADELERLYVTGPWAKTFNATSTLQIRLRRPDGSPWPAVIYDLAKVSKIRRPLFYFVILAGISRESRRALPPGVERPRRLCVIDEFRYLTGGSNLAEWVADQIATSRSFRVAYCLIDQNPRTLAGVSADGAQVVGDSDDLTSRQHMLDNIRYILSFRLEDNAAKVMRKLYPDLTQSHIDFLSRAGVGQALLKDGERIVLLDMALRVGEQEHFLGS